MENGNRDLQNLIMFKDPTDPSPPPVTRSEKALSNSTIIGLLQKLDAGNQPGLTERQFTSLLTRCEFCHLILTRRRTTTHQCGIHNSTVPVTAESDAEESESEYILEY